MADNNQQPVAEQDIREILQIRRDKLKQLRELGQDPFVQTRYEVTAHSSQIQEQFAQMEGSTVSLAGRLMAKRGMGKVSFCDLQDRDGRIQIYVRQDDLGEDAYAGWRKVDIGDIVGVRGFVFRTQKGEISVHVQEYVLLSKSLLPLPEKFHGLTDKETRYRQRYVDLIVNPEVKRTFASGPVHSVCPPVSGRAGLHGGGDAGPQHHLGGRQRPTLHYTSQHPGHRYVHAHCHGASAQALVVGGWDGCMRLAGSSDDGDGRQAQP